MVMMRVWNLRWWRRGALLGALLCLASAVQAASGTVVFLTVKSGVQNAEGTGDTLFERLERDHGAVRDSRQVNIQGVELDFYAATSRNAGLAVGAELQQYSKTFRFRTNDPTKTSEDLSLAGRAFLFTLKGFLRWGPVLPFIGVGSGNYYVQYHQATENLSFLDSASNVLNTRVGARWLLGRWGLLLETGHTAAPLRVRTTSGTSILNLGGNYTSAGLSWAW
jgi:hypothetical protein